MQNKPEPSDKELLQPRLVKADLVFLGAADGLFLVALFKRLEYSGVIANGLGAVACSGKVKGLIAIDMRGKLSGEALLNLLASAFDRPARRRCRRFQKAPHKSKKPYRLSPWKPWFRAKG